MGCLEQLCSWLEQGLVKTCRVVGGPEFRVERDAAQLISLSRLGLLYRPLHLLPIDCHLRSWSNLTESQYRSSLQPYLGSQQYSWRRLVGAESEITSSILPPEEMSGLAAASQCLSWIVLASATATATATAISTIYLFSPMKVCFNLI